MNEKTHLENQIDRRRTEEDKDSGFDEILHWNQDHITIKERGQEYVRSRQTFKRLDKKT